MAGTSIARKFLIKPLRGLAKPPYFATTPSVSYSSASRLAKAPSVSDSSDSILATGWRLGKAALVSNFLVSFLTTAGICIAIEKHVDVQSVFEKLHLPRSDRPNFNNPIKDHESDNTASFGDKKNRTAELAASKGGSLALALLINRGLFPLRLPFAAALTRPVAELLARWSTVNKSKAQVQVTLLPITIHVEPVLVALCMLWITGSFEYAKKPDLKGESASDGGAISLEIAGQVLTKGLKELENLMKKDQGSGGSQLVVKDLKEEYASSRGGAISLEMGCQTKAMVDSAEEAEADAVFLVNEPKNAMNNLKVDPKGAGKMLYPPFKPHALDEIYARLGISYIDMVKKLLGGMESGPVGRKGCNVAAPSGMPFDPLRESMDTFMEKFNPLNSKLKKGNSTLVKEGGPHNQATDSVLRREKT